MNGRHTVSKRRRPTHSSLPKKIYKKIIGLAVGKNQRFSFVVGVMNLSNLFPFKYK
jgi:hypothetical protein